MLNAPKAGVTQQTSVGRYCGTRFDPCSQELYQFGSSSVIAIRPLMQLDLDMAQRYEVLGRQEQNVSTKRVSPLAASRVNSLDLAPDPCKLSSGVKGPLEQDLTHTGIYIYIQYVHIYITYTHDFLSMVFCRCQDRSPSPSAPWLR